MNPLKPVRFYGSQLPRPRFVDEELEGRRVSPPVPVNDALLNWAKDANWYMGGVSTKRQRMQGKIEGRLKKLKDESEDDTSLSKRRSGRKSKFSPGKISPKSPSVKAELDGEESGEFKVVKKKVKSGGVRGRDGRGTSESQVIVGKKTAAIHPEVPSVSASIEFPFYRKPTESALPSDDRDLDSGLPFGDGASVLETPQSKQVENSGTPVRARASHVSASVEYPVRRRGRKEGVLPDKEDSDSDVDMEELQRLERSDRPSRRSSRVTKTRRSLKEFASSDSEEER